MTMIATGAIAFLTQALTLTPLIVKAGIDLAGFISDIKDVVAKGEPTTNDWDELHHKEAVLRRQLTDTSRDVPVGDGILRPSV